MNHIHHNDALSVLGSTSCSSVDLVYIDPPFGTGDTQQLTRKKDGQIVSKVCFNDPESGYIEWLQAHMLEVRRVIKDTGTVYLHLDHHWVHYAKVMMDNVFGRECFLNEVIWSYNFGGRGKQCWPKKHDNILVYVKDPKKYVFNWDDIDRVPYAAPEMQRVGRSPEEAERRIELGQVPTDVWQMSIVGTNSKERNGYPTQKPVKLIERIIKASCPPDGIVMDVFAGSGTTGDAAHRLGRNFVLADVSVQSMTTMKERFKDVLVTWHEP